MRNEADFWVREKTHFPVRNVLTYEAVIFRPPTRLPFGIFQVQRRTSIHRRTTPMRPLLILLVGAGPTLLMIGCGPSGSDATGAETPPDSIRKAVERTITSINDMRESLAATIDTPTVDKSTFQRVCKPVGKRMKQVSAEQGWRMQQLARKYRNPAHTLDEEARRLYERFAESPDLTDTWIRTSRENTEGWRYARRITVQSSCLACHGPKEQRPEFIKKGYPEDRAHGFEAGDLRGLYTVFVPDSVAPTTPPNAGASRR